MSLCVVEISRVLSNITRPLSALWQERLGHLVCGIYATNDLDATKMARTSLSDIHNTLKYASFHRPRERRLGWVSVYGKSISIM